MKSPLGDKSSTFTFEGPPFLRAQLSPPTAPTTLPEMVNLQWENFDIVTRTRNLKQAPKHKTQINQNKPCETEIYIFIAIATSIINNNRDL